MTYWRDAFTWPALRAARREGAEAALLWAVDHPPPDAPRLADYTPKAAEEFRLSVEEWLADGLAVLGDGEPTP